MLVKDAMEEQLVLLDPDESLGQAALKMVGADCRGAAVVDVQGGLVGFLNQTDVIQGVNVLQKRFKILLPPEVPYGVGFAEEVKARDARAAFAELFERSVATRMRRKVPTVEADQRVEGAVKAMAESGLYELPVVDEGQVVGIITQGSILRAMALAGVVGAVQEPPTAPLPATPLG